MKVHYKDDTSEIWGYYNDDDKNIPTPNISISTQVWQEAIAKGATHINLATNELYIKESEPLGKDELLKNLERDFKTKVQEIMDSKAREKGYDNINSAVSYAGFENPFQDEAIRLGKWRSKVWQFGYSLLEQISSGEINIQTMTMDEILDKLPKLNEKE